MQSLVSLASTKVLLKPQDNEMYERMAALELDIIIKGGNQKQIYIGFCLTLGTIKKR